MLNYTIMKCIANIIFLSAVFCLATSCHHTADLNVDKKERRMLLQMDKLVVINPRINVLRYADSVFQSQPQKSPFLRAWHYKAYADEYYKRGDYQKVAAVCRDSAIALIEKQNLADTAWASYYFATNIMKANLFYSSGHYSSAIDVYFKIKELSDKDPYKCQIGDRVDDYIGLILFQQRKFDAARKYFAMGLALEENCPDDEFKAGRQQELINNIGECFVNTGKNDSALVYYRRAMRLVTTTKLSSDAVQDKIQREVCEGVIAGDIAQIFVQQGKLDSAEILFKQNISINSVIHKNEFQNAEVSQLHLAHLYRLRKQFPQLKETLAGMRKNLDTVPNDEVELGWRKLMAEYSDVNNLPGREAAYYKSYVSLKDSLDHQKATINQSDINRELEAKKQQMDNLVLQKDNQLSHLYLWITVSLSLMALVIVGLVFYYYKKGKKNIRALLLLNSEIGEQRDKLEFATVELGKSNAEKERILRVVAHDLRDPIGGAATVVNMVINEDLSPEFELQNLTLVEKTLGNSMTLINELLVFDPDPERLVLELAPADINEIAGRCVGLMQLIAAKKDQKITLLSPEDPLMIILDKARIERMLNNLLGNAIKFSPAGETIIMEIKKEGNDVLIMVKDNGIGIPAAMQGELFNTFSNTRRVGTAGEKSFGLGLSICKQIAEAHGGKIWVESEPGKGSIFFCGVTFSTMIVRMMLTGLRKIEIHFLPS